MIKIEAVNEDSATIEMGIKYSSIFTRNTHIGTKKEKLFKVQPMLKAHKDNLAELKNASGLLKVELNNLETKLTTEANKKAVKFIFLTLLNIFVTPFVVNYLWGPTLSLFVRLYINFLIIRIV